MGRRTAAGVPWLLFAIAAQRVFSYCTTFLMARLLDPTQFGLVSFALIFIGAAAILEDLGVPAALIYGKYDIAAVGGTALTINIASATVLFAAIWLASPLVAAYGGHQDVGPVLITLSVAIVINSLASVQSALLIRDLAYRRKFLPDVLSVLANGIVSVGLALLRFGVWSMVIGYLAKAITSTLVMWRLSKVRLTPQFKWSIARQLLGYGSHVSVLAIVNFMVNNVDYFIVGHALGMAALGIYTLAFNVANMQGNLISQQIGPLQFSALSRLRDEKESQYRLFSDFLSIVCSISVVFGIAIFVCFPGYSLILLGQKWANIGEPLRILVVFGVMRALTIQLQPMYKAGGRPDLAWKLTALRLVVVAPLLAWSASFGLGSVAIAETLVAVVFFPISLIPIAQILKVSMWRICRPLVPQLAGCGVAVLLLVVAYMRTSLYLVGGPLAGPAILAALAIAAYAATMLLLDRRMVVLCRLGITSVLNRRARAFPESQATS